MMMSSQVVKLPSKKLAERLTCPLCENLFNDATTITECLHTCEFFLFFSPIFLCFSCWVLDLFLCVYVRSFYSFLFVIVLMALSVTWVSLD